MIIRLLRVKAAVALNLRDLRLVTAAAQCIRNMTLFMTLFEIASRQHDHQAVAKAVLDWGSGLLFDLFWLICLCLK
jgi:hypothetical protein